MNSCVQCGLPIPDDQRTCSRCYGDIGHGRDGYYRGEMEESERQHWEQERERERRKQEE